MKFRCAIVDDEKPARDRIRRLLAEHDDFEVVAEAADAASAVRLIDELDPQLCFLDVQMPEGDGFQVLERVKRIPTVIFTTAYDRYAVRAFEVNSLDYLLKPFSRRRFAEALDRARGALARRVAGPPARMLRLLEEIRRDQRKSAEGAAAAEPSGSVAGEPQRISGRRGSRIVLLDPAQILWFEADETLVFARTARGRFLVERTLVDLEAELSSGYFRAHRRFLVNLGQVAEILPGDAGTYRIVFHGEAEKSVPLSRRQARKLRERFPW